MTNSFASTFDRACDVRAQAPGRVNLMGDHTDYNGGMVLPIAIEHYTHMEASRREDGKVCVSSYPFTQNGPVSFVLGEEKRLGNWLDYIQGVTSVLARHGYKITGFNVSLSTTIPIGGGLSSSAALEVSLLRGLRQLFSLSYDDVELARLGQKVETEFVGAPVGIMDQMASSLADSHHALLLNTRTLAFEQVPWPDDMELIIVDSGITHKHASGGYKQRRVECQEICDRLKVEYLVDVPLGRLSELDTKLQKRLRHVIKENRRVQAAADAMKANDLSRLGRIFFESHESLRDDYEVSVPEIDKMVEYAKTEGDIAGARLTGGGFGGAVIFIGPKGKTRPAVLRILTKIKHEIVSVPRVV